MYSRDYILKLVQQFAQIMARLAGLKERGDVNQAQEVINEAYKGLFGLERDYLQTLNSNDFIQTFKIQHTLTYNQLEVLAKLMVEDAALAGDGNQAWYEKSLLILQYLNVEQKLYSFEREQLIEKIKDHLTISRQ